MPVHFQRKKTYYGNILELRLGIDQACWQVPLHLQSSHTVLVETLSNSRNY